MDIKPDNLSMLALEIASKAGATTGQVRVAQHENRGVSLRDGNVENVGTQREIALSVRVVVQGSWGFAATTDLTQDGAINAANKAIAIAKLSAAVSKDPVELANEPSYGTVDWKLPFEIDPIAVSDSEVIELLKNWHEIVAKHNAVHHVDVSAAMGKDITFFADLSGNQITQERVRTSGTLTAVHIGDNGFDDMRTIAPPAGRGYEYLLGTGWDWENELNQLPHLLEEKTKSPSVSAGTWDLVVDPTNLWLTIHESIGHATELDRALGYEANYAGSSFATIEKLNNFKYGSEIMNVTGDRNSDFGLSTVGFDDEGVKAQKWDLIKDGILVGYQTDRNIARKIGLSRSNGCAFADSALHNPIQRMPNVSLQPGGKDLSTKDLISQVDHGIYIVGDKSWSIDMQRFNFQFTGQRFFEIKNGQLIGQLKDVVYQSKTPDFWGSMSAVGGKQTYLLGGALNCGKGQPGQTAPVSHGCPSAVFRNINVLNGKQEAGQ